MKYEIINPHDRCFISAENPFTAAVTCFLIGQGSYGLRDENDTPVIRPFQTLEDAFNIIPDKTAELINKHRIDVYNCLRSFEYGGEPTSCTNLKETAEYHAKNLKKRLIQDGDLKE